MSTEHYDNTEHVQPALAKRTLGVLFNGSDYVVGVDITATTIRIDYNGGNTAIYIGWAAPGALTSDSVWRISKHAYDVAENLTSSIWADGDTNFDNEWDERASLSYS